MTPADSPVSHLRSVIERVVQAVHPERIILFGSAATDTAHAAEDLDLLIVKAGISSRRQVAQTIYKALIGIPVPVDVVVVTPDDIDRLEDGVATIIGPAIREGRVVYVA